MEQLIVFDKLTDQTFYLEKVEHPVVETNFAFFTEDGCSHRLFSSIQPPRYIVLQGDIENPVAKDINTGVLINCNDYPEKL